MSIADDPHCDEIARLRHRPELDDATFLLGIGAMKCATSWAYWYLHSIPEIRVSAIKELNFFSTRFTTCDVEPKNPIAMKRLLNHLTLEGDPVRNLRDRPHFRASLDCVQMIYDPNAYFDHFLRIRKPTTRTYCDITPAYSVIGENGFSYVKAFFETQKLNLKLFYIMRDPVDRLWSHLRFHQSHTPGLAATANWRQMIRDPRIIERSDYRTVVETLDRNFGQDQVLYLFYETLFTTEATSRLCRFANVPFRPADHAAARHVTPVKDDMTLEMRSEMRKALAPQYDFCRARFGDSVPPDWDL